MSELERMVDAEGSVYEEHDGGHRKPYTKRKKESFLSDFLDF